MLTYSHAVADPSKARKIAEGKVLQSLRKKRGLSLRGLADKSGIPFDRIQNKETGAKLFEHEREAFQRALGVDPSDWELAIDAKIDEMDAPADADGDRAATPRGAAGIPAIAAAYNAYHRIGSLAVRADGLAPVVVMGDSMAPKLNDGELAMIEPLPPLSKPPVGAIVLVLVRNDEEEVEPCFCQLQETPDSTPKGRRYMLVKYNARGPARIVDAAGISAIARVVEVCRRV